MIYGIENQKAPSWQGVTWFNLPNLPNVPNKQASLDVENFLGKVVYLYCFQSWCPGCHSHGFPLLEKMTETFKNNDKVSFLTIQTTFEGFGTNTLEEAQKIVNQYQLNIPAGHDAGLQSSGSVVMQRYRSGGTPWTIVIDKEGIVKYNNFQAEASPMTSFIQSLL